jgi:GNAT superfamily N-acetyltransferase
MARINIRPATPDDSSLILSFIRELADYEKLLHVVGATEDRLRRTLFGDDRAAEAVVAHLDDEPVGFAVFFRTYSTFLAKPGLYLEDLYVRPAARDAGVGRALLTYLARLTVERGWGRLEWSVLDWNEPAIGFYRKLGAEPLTEWTTFRLSGEALEKLGTSFRSIDL